MRPASFLKPNIERENMAKRLSPAQISMAKKLEAQALRAAVKSGIAVARPETGPVATAYELLRAQMGEQMRELKDIQSTEGKIARKAQMLADYDDHIDTVILTAEEEGKALQDEVFVRLMIWHFDVASKNFDHYPRAFELAGHVLQFGLQLPENFKRTPAALIREMVADAAQEALNIASPEDAAPFPLEVLQKVEQLTHGYDIVDVVGAKMHKAIGLLLARRAKAVEGGATDGPAGGLRAAREEAVKHLRRAMELNKTIGVKRDIEQLDRALAKTPADA